MSNTVVYHRGDVHQVMASMPDGSVDLVVTSPPFLALRSYLPEGHPDKHREIGSEPTPAAFLDTMLGLTADWRRVVADWGSIAVEIGDTYAGSGGAGGDYDNPQSRAGQPKFKGSALADRKNKVLNENGQRMQQGPGWPLAKSLCGIPTLYTWSLAYGRNLLTGAESPAGQWRIRNLLTWTRPNPPVGALGDKFRPATSFVTVACIDSKRWFDLDAVRTGTRTPGGRARGPKTGGAAEDHRDTLGEFTADMAAAGAPPLDWWDANDWQPLHRLATQPYKGSHYAAFPVALPARLIEAMCPREVCTVCGEPRRRIVESKRVAPDGSVIFGDMNGRRKVDGHDGRGLNTEGGVGGVRSISTTLGWSDCGHDTYRPGIVLDPFGGSGTTAVAAARMGRDSVLIDLDERNVDLARQRLRESMLLLDEQRDGDTVTWTVDAQMPGVKGENPDQLSLFGAAS